MQTKKYLYAAVGAQVAVVRSAQAKLEELKSMIDENSSSASSEMKSRIEVWAGEGEQFLGKVTDTKALDDLTSKVDFDQVQTQVNKLRDQLEDIVGTWRANFRPESKPAEKVVVSAAATAPKAAAKPTTTTTKKPAAKKPAAKPAAKATTAKSTASKSTATKPAAKKPAAKKPAAKPAAKATTAKTTASKPAAQKAS